MLNRLLSILFLFFSVLVFSQTQYNTFTHQDDWLTPNPGQTSRDFIKIKVIEEGIYRVGYSDLMAKGFSFSTESAIQLFRRGIEQAIYIQDNGDGFNASNDYIEFYGQKNDGELDAELYFPETIQPHKYHSLFSDTSVYFLTSRDNAQGLRVGNFTSNVVAAEDFYMHEQMQLYTDKYSMGIDHGSEVRVPFYSNGEGWFRNRLLNGQSVTTSFEVSDVNNTSNSQYMPKIELLVAGKTASTHSFDVSISDDGVTYQVLNSYSINNWDHEKIVIPVSYAQLGSSGNIDVRVSVTNSDGRLLVGYIKLVYPRNYEFSGIDNPKIYLKDKNNGDNVTLNLNNISGPNVNYLINSNGEIYRGENNSQINFQYHDGDEFIYSSTIAGISTISSSSLKKVTLKIPETNGEFVIIANKKLQAGALNYRNYRSSSSGGNYNSKVFYIDELMDVFTYGEFTPAAIRRFCDFLISNGNNAEHLFLIGKGLTIYNSIISASSGSYRGNGEVPITRNGVTENSNLIPAFGNPGSDIIYSSHITSDSLWYPEIPIGRLTAISNDEVNDYLAKVQEYESSLDADWKKRLFHLVGGQSNEYTLFENYMRNWEITAESPLFGGTVKTYSKNEPDPNIKLDEEINEGVRLLTFMGHSSSDISDIDIGRVSDLSKGYNNPGKYPVLLLNGCQTGDFYKDDTGFGEDWVITENKGAIALISSSTYAYAGTLKSYTDLFYNVAFRDSATHESTLGGIIQSVNKKYGIVSEIGNTNLAHTMNINLLGDPAIPLFGRSKPDLEINSNSVFLQPVDEPIVTAVSDSFNIGMVIRNFGKYELKDSFYISIERTYGGTTINYPPKLYEALPNRDTLYFGIHSPDIRTYGLNNFKINIDFNSDFQTSNVDEYDEFNNEAIFQHVIPLSGVIPIFPKEFEIVSLSTQNEYNAPWVLTAQSTNLLVDNRDYIFEIDTTMEFNSLGFKKSEIVNGNSIVSWDATNSINDMLLSISNSTISNPDSIVFYWRVRYKDLLEGEEDLWGYSSFIYIFQSPGGWAQAHYYQFLRDKFDYVRLDSNDRKWKFNQISSKISISTVGPNDNLDVLLPKITQDAINPGYIPTAHSYNERSNGFLCNVYHNKTFEQQKNIMPNLNDPWVRKNGKYYYFKLTSQAHMDAFVQFINNVPDDYYVAITTRMRSNYSDYVPDLQNAFTLIGATNFPTNDSTGYVIMGQKNGSALFEKQLAPSEPFDTLIELNYDLDFGLVNSTVIGPVTKWDKFYRNISTENDDVFGIDIYAIKEGLSNDSLMFQNVTADGFNINLDASVYPYIRLVEKVEDLTEKTPPQMRNWIVTYKAEIPEGVIVASSDVDDYSERTFYEGEEKEYNFRFKNISKNAFKDDLVVGVNYISKSSSSNSDEFTIPAPEPGEHTDFTYTIKSANLKGDYVLQLTVNPSIQVEHYYHNNSISVPFKVIADEVHPILDVTFDGVHIMDYDIVSPKTEITIGLKDENTHLIMQNKSLITYEVRSNNKEGEIVSMTEVSFDTSRNKSNQIELKIRPLEKEGLADGEYWLIVKGTDTKGNQSGSQGYEIHFTVVNKTTMTHFYPYPNPFSTSMRFAYTLTGSEQPDQIKIQIMTISGKIVREITQFELGRLKIGKHLTDFVWDGTDEFGNKLANGVYLYKVIANYDGEQIEHRRAGTQYKYASGTDESGGETKGYYGETKADELFKKGWGKLYIMR